MLIMYWDSLSCTALCRLQLGLGGLSESISECPARFPKRLLKPLGLRVLCYWVKCPTSDCDKHVLCRLQVAPLYLLDPTIKAPQVRARKDQRWQNCSMVSSHRTLETSCKHLSVLHTLRLTSKAILKEHIHSCIHTQFGIEQLCPVCSRVSKTFWHMPLLPPERLGKRKLQDAPRTRLSLQ